MKRIIQISFLLTVILSIFSCEREIPVTSIVMNQEKADLFVDESLQLYVSISPSDATDRTTLWGTTTPSVASVTQDGLVRAISEGVSTITATVGKRSTNCIVTVRRKEIPVSSIALDKHRITVNRNASETLIATVIPDNATNKIVQWSSENESIALVNQKGVVFGVDKGVTAITARIDNAATSCVVTVLVPIDSVKLNKTSIRIKTKEEYQLKAEVYPSDASNVELSWSSNNSEVATVDNSGKVTAIKPGKAIVSVQSDGVSCSCEVWVDDSSSLSSFVDLGLSVDWASFNLGASAVNEVGDPYAWGEVAPKSYYDWSTYQHCKGTDRTLTKYCNVYLFGYENYQDDKSVLELVDDAVYQSFGDGYRIPSDSEWVELLQHCTWEFVNMSGSYGYKVISNIDGYREQWIFLPIGPVEHGMRTGEYHNDSAYWSSSLSSPKEYFPDWAWAVIVDFSRVERHYYYRCDGLMIRPIREK